MKRNKIFLVWMIFAALALIEGCKAPVNKDGFKELRMNDPQSADEGALKNENEACFGSCGCKGGSCSFCGGGSCCRLGWTDGDGCLGTNGCKDNHCCVEPKGKVEEIEDQLKEMNDRMEEGFGEFQAQLNGIEDRMSATNQKTEARLKKLEDIVEQVSEHSNAEIACSLKGLGPDQWENHELQTAIKQGDYGFVTIKDWEVDLAAPSNFQTTEEGIRVLHDGIYFIYSNFAFTGWGTNAECAYQLKYGNQRKICRWYSSVTDHAENPLILTRIQPCYLGVSARLSGGTLVSIVFNHNVKCPTNENYFKTKAHMLSAIGVVKLS